MSSIRTERRDVPSEPHHAAGRAMTRRTFAASALGAGTMAALGPVSILAAPSASKVPSAVSAQDDIQTDMTVTIPLLPYGQPVTIDPHRTVNWGPFWTLLPHVWAGLLRFDRNGGVEADLAASVESNDDLTVWTATLRDGVAFASGTPVTAADFVASWKRALDPSALSPMSASMADVKGFADYTSGKSMEIGFEATDDTTVQITLERGTAEFPYRLATFVWAVVDPAVLADTSVADPFVAASGAGGWQFTEFVSGQSITMTPNPHSWEQQSPSISTVTWAILDGADAEATALDRYRSGEFASADVPLALFDSVNGDDAVKDQLVSVEQPGSTLAIGMDFLQEPFNDPRVRQAVAASIDRNAWATTIWNGSFVAADGFTPPAAAAVDSYTPPSGIAFDPGKAKSLLSDAGFDPATTAVEIVYHQPASDSAEDQQRVADLLKMIQDNSGIVITQDTTLTTDQIASLQQDNGGRQFDLVWWWPDVSSPTFLGTVGSSTSPFMEGWFNWAPDLPKVGDLDPGANAKQFSDLVSGALTNGQRDSRNTALQQAEKLLLDDAVYIPLGYWVQRYVQQPWLQGTQQGAWTGRIPLRFDSNVVVRGKPE
ncbi:MAG: ABC transporter substrate-binding protein [Thermomicrobiales bacterium]